MFKTTLIVYDHYGHKIHSSKSLRHSFKTAKSDANDFWKSIRPDIPKIVTVIDKNTGKEKYRFDNFEKLNFKLEKNES